MDTQKRKILLVEDETVMREGMRDWLTENGYDVESADTGEEALQRIKKEDFGVIVLDLRLLGIDGLQVLEQAKELKSEAKGIIITAHPTPETQAKAQKLGAIDYLVKPFNIENLEKIIRNVLGEPEKKLTGKEYLWLELNNYSYRLCTRNYQYDSYAFTQGTYKIA
jgi:two-component system response regulator AtoC